MPKPPEDSLIERMKKLPLWQWGGITIFAGIITNMAMSLTIQGGDMSRAEKRAAQMGGAVACGLFIVVGIALIVIHFVKKKK